MDGGCRSQSCGRVSSARALYASSNNGGSPDAYLPALVSHGHLLGDPKRLCGLTRSQLRRSRGKPSSPRCRPSTVTGRANKRSPCSCCRGSSSSSTCLTRACRTCTAPRAGKIARHTYTGVVDLKFGSVWFRGCAKDERQLYSISCIHARGASHSSLRKLHPWNLSAALTYREALLFWGQRHQHCPTPQYGRFEKDAMNPRYSATGFSWIRTEINGQVKIEQGIQPRRPIFPNFRL